MEKLADRGFYPYIYKFLGIEFNPDHHCGFDDPSKISPDIKTVELPGYSNKYEVVDYLGVEWLVHGTNNLLYLVEAYIGKQKGADIPDPSESMSAYLYRRALDQHPEIETVLDSVVNNHPDLLACLSLVYQERQQELAVASYLRDSTRFTERPLGRSTPDDETRKRRKIVLSYTLEAVLAESEGVSIDAVAWCR